MIAKRLVILLLLVFLQSFLVEVETSCSTHDASWKANNKGPVVSQPSRSDPTKILLSWNAILENSRCVDKYTLFMWQDGEVKERGQKFVITDKEKTSMVVSVDPCLSYSFQVEFEEDDLTHTDKELSGIAKFRTEAISTVGALDRTKFQVSYAYDPLKRQHDLTKAVVRFPRQLLKNPNCILSVDVSAAELPKKITQTPTRTPSLTGMLSNALGASSGSYVNYPYHEGHYNPGSSGQIALPGILAVPVPYGQQAVGGSGSFGPNQGVGGSGGFGNQHGVGGSGGYGNQHGVGGSGGYGNQQGVGGSGAYGHQHSSGGSGSFGQQQTNGGSGSYSSALGYFQQRETSSNNRPTYSSGAGTNSRPSLMAVGKASPPFLRDIIEITVPLTSCNPYIFTVKITSPLKAVIAEVKDIVLPQLSEAVDYKPPKLSSIFVVETKFVNQQLTPIINLVPNSGVPDLCLTDFFEAVDRHISDLEWDLSYHIDMERKNEQMGQSLRSKITNLESEQLGQHGCKCTSPIILVNTTDTDMYTRFKEVYGFYKHEGMQNGRPFYGRMDSRSAPNISPSTDRPPFAGQKAASAKDPRGKREAAPTGEKKFFLYWDNSRFSWTIGEKMNKDDAYLRTDKKSTAKCPADPETLKKWEYSGTLAWRDEAKTSATCLKI